VTVTQEALTAISHKEGYVVGLGCGYGGLENTLAEQQIQGQIPDTIQIIGIDQSQKFLEGAKAGDKTGRVEYRLGDMRTTNLPDNCAVLTTSEGRNDTHLEDEEAFDAARDERVRITMPGGGILFDMPDPLLGDYLKERLNHIDVLRDLKIPVDKLGEEDYWLSERAYIVDGPKGEEQHMYNRYTPTVSRIIEKYRKAGCDIKIMRRMPIPGGHGDENVYFLAIKKEGEANPEEQRATGIRQQLEELAGAA
jgi:SAM-dependent methyltransferase